MSRPASNKTPDRFSSPHFFAEEEARALRFNLGPLFYLTGIFFLNFISRIVLSPLLITVEKDLRLGHKEAGFLFLLTSLGYSLAALISGFLSSRVSHRKTIFISTVGAGGILLLLTLSQTVWIIQLLFFLLGFVSGFYLPSGMAMMTSLIRHQDWGKAIAIHELAPNVGFVAAPFLAEIFLFWGSWRLLYGLLGVLSLFIGTAFILGGRGGDFSGQAPTARVVGELFRQPALWIMMVLFGLGIGASMGVYTMLPLYLVVERGLERDWANTLVAVSRISGIFIALVAGWFVDRLGVKKSLFLFLLITGHLTFLLGWARDTTLIGLVFLQPMLAVCFFPAGFTALNKVSPLETRNLVVSLTVPLGFLLGGGAVPAFIGLAGERYSFSLGFFLVGVVTLVSLPLIRFLRFDSGTGAPVSKPKGQGI
jgi:NNP family nitrate/nitrite transporter-like MFS transporter